MSMGISWAKKVQLAKCDISVGFPKSSHIWFFSMSLLLSLLLSSSAALNFCFSSSGDNFLICE